MATWPSTIPITRENFRETPPDRVIRSDMDVGPAKIRRRSTREVRPVEMELFLTPSQLQTFDVFYISNDAFSFSFMHPRTGLSVDARFTSPPSYVLDETMWRVSVALEIV